MSQGGKAKVVVEGKKSEGVKKVGYIKRNRVAAKTGDKKAQQRLDALDRKRKRIAAERAPGKLLRAQRTLYRWALAQRRKVLGHRKYEYKIRKVNRKRRAEGLPRLPIAALSLPLRPGQHSRKRITKKEKKPVKGKKEKKTEEQKKRAIATQKFAEARRENKRLLKERRQIARLRKLGILPYPDRASVSRTDSKGKKVHVGLSNYFGKKPYDPTHAVLFRPNNNARNLLKKKKIVFNKFHLRVSKSGKIPSVKPRLTVRFPTKKDAERKRKLEQQERASKRAKLVHAEGKKSVKKDEKKVAKKKNPKVVALRLKRKAAKKVAQQKAARSRYVAKRPILPFFDVESPHAHRRASTPKTRGTKAVHPLRTSIQPGTVLIRVKPPHLGRRVVFLKQLESGRLLVAGPKKVNGVPVHRVHQKFVIATSTRVAVKPSWFAHLREKEIFVKSRRSTTSQKKSEGKFFNEKKAARKQAQKRVLNAKILGSLTKFVDKKITRSITRRPLLVEYLRNRFTLGPRTYPHLLKF